MNVWVSERRGQQYHPMSPSGTVLPASQDSGVQDQCQQRGHRGSDRDRDEHPGWKQVRGRVRLQVQIQASELFAIFTNTQMTHASHCLEN